MNHKLKQIMTVVCVLLLHPMINPGSFALAKRKKSLKAFSFVVEGGKASQGVCDGENEVPRKLKRISGFTKASSYMGSELLSESKGTAETEMWKHFFRVRASCNAVLEKTPSSIKDATLKNIKNDLPPEDSTEDDEPAKTDTPETPDAG